MAWCVNKKLHQVYQTQHQKHSKDVAFGVIGASEYSRTKGAATTRGILLKRNARMLDVGNIPSVRCTKYTLLSIYRSVNKIEVGLHSAKCFLCRTWLVVCLQSATPTRQGE